MLELLSAEFKPYGLVGIMFIVIAIIVAIMSFYLGRRLRGREKTYNTLIFICSLVFIGLEIFHEVERYIELGGYDWSSFPFQFCTTTLYLGLLVPLLKKGKTRNSILMFFCTFTFLSGILPIVFAQGNLFRWPTVIQVLFSFIWHVLLFFVGGVSIGYFNIGKNYQNDRKKMYGAIIVFVLLTCVAQVLNTLIHYFGPGWEVGSEVIKEAGWCENYYFDPDSASLFYISPYFKSNINIIFGPFWLKFGWLANWILYDLIFIFGAYVVYFTIMGIRKIMDKVRYRDAPYDMR